MQLTSTETRLNPEKTLKAAQLDRGNKSMVPDGERLSFAALMMQTLTGAATESRGLLPFASPAPVELRSKPDQESNKVADTLPAKGSDFIVSQHAENYSRPSSSINNNPSSASSFTEANGTSSGTDHQVSKNSSESQLKETAKTGDSERSAADASPKQETKKATTEKGGATSTGSQTKTAGQTPQNERVEVQSDTLKTLESLTDAKSTKKVDAGNAEENPIEAESENESRTEVKTTPLDSKKDLKKTASHANEQTDKKLQSEGQLKSEQVQAQKPDGKQVSGRKQSQSSNKEAISGERISWQAQTDAGRVEPKIKANDAGRLQSEIINKQASQGLNKPIQAKTGASGQFTGHDLAGGFGEKAAAQLTKASKSGSTSAPLTRQAGQNFDNLVQKIRMSVVDNQNGTVSMRLNPEHLGRVFVKFQLKDGKLSAQVQVENAAAQKLFASGVTELFQKFRDAGIEVESFQLDVRDEAGGQQASGEGRRRENGYSTGGLSGGLGEEVDSNLGVETVGEQNSWEPGNGDALNIRA